MRKIGNETEKLSFPVETVEQNFASEQEKQKYIDEVWSRVRRKENIKKWIRGSCLAVGIIAPLIIEIIFRDSLPRWLIERRNTYSRRYRGSISWLDIICMGIGALIGQCITQILIKLMKLDK